MADTSPSLLRSGRSADELVDDIDEMRGDDIDWRGGRAFSLVYNADDPDEYRVSPHGEAIPYDWARKDS
jgi:hypothetical protein